MSLNAIGWRAISEINSQPMKPFNGPFNVDSKMI